MISNLALLLLSPVPLIVGVLYARHAVFGRRPNRSLPMWALLCLVVVCSMYAVALVPLAVSLVDRAHPDFQRFYYSSIGFLALLGWAGTLSTVLRESVRSGHAWSAIGVAAWATLLFASGLVAATFLVAVQV